MGTGVMVTNTELGWVSKKAVVVYFKYLCLDKVLVPRDTRLSEYPSGLFRVGEEKLPNFT
jgi:hypothetical protein